MVRTLLKEANRSVKLSLQRAIDTGRYMQTSQGFTKILTIYLSIFIHSVCLLLDLNWPAVNPFILFKDVTSVRKMNNRLSMSQIRIEATKLERKRTDLFLLCYFWFRNFVCICVVVVVEWWPHHPVNIYRRLSIMYLLKQTKT